jgi:hypothetical protein
MAERIFNINGVYYVSRVNEFGVYMDRVNADGTPWVSPDQYNPAELASGISIGPRAPAVIEVAPVAKPKRRWWQFWG